MYPANSHVIRLAGDADELALERLAQLDSARPLEHPILVAEIHGRVAAAIDLDERRTIADPFLRTAYPARAAAGPRGRVRREGTHARRRGPHPRGARAQPPRVRLARGGAAGPPRRARAAPS